jgi:hypothetical protein
LSFRAFQDECIDGNILIRIQYPPGPWMAL